MATPWRDLRLAKVSCHGSDFQSLKMEPKGRVEVYCPLSPLQLQSVEKLFLPNNPQKCCLPQLESGSTVTEKNYFIIRPPLVSSVSCLFWTLETTLEKWRINNELEPKCRTLVEFGPFVASLSSREIGSNSAGDFALQSRATNSHATVVRRSLLIGLVSWQGRQLSRYGHEMHSVISGRTSSELKT